MSSTTQASNDESNTSTPTIEAEQDSISQTVLNIHRSIQETHEPSAAQICGELLLDPDKWINPVTRRTDGSLSLSIRHANLIDASDVTDEERAQLFRRFDQAIVELAPDRQYMPLGANKAPAITGTCSLDSDKARSMLHDPEEAYQALLDGHHGFCLYAGRDEHGTDDLVAVDHDDMNEFPLDTLAPTLTVQSQSGQGYHEIFRNDGSVSNATGVGGEIRATNWYVVVPGSIGSDGGVYHVSRDASLSSLSHDDLPDTLQPNSGSSNGGGENVQVHNFSSDIELVPHHELGAEQVSDYTNAFEKTLEHCRDIDEYLASLLGQKYPSQLENEKGELLTDTSRIEEKLVSRLRYHWFDHQQQADILRCYRQQFREEKTQKLDRHDYVTQTIAKYADDTRRWFYNDSFNSHIVYRNHNTAPITAGGTGDNDNDSDHNHIRQQEARDRCQDRINEAFEKGMHVLLDAIPSLGKSSGTIRAVDQTDVPATVLTARHDIYDEYKSWARKHDLSVQTLPSMVRDCPSMRGDHGDAWQQRMQDLYIMGVSPAQIHRKAEFEYGETPPCCREGSCEYDDNYPSNIENTDVIVGHYTHAHNDALTEDRMVVFDEFVGQNFIDDWDSHKAMGEVVSSWLDGFDDPPVTDTDGLIEARGNPDRYDLVLEWIESSATINLNAVSTDTNDNQHMLAPVLAKGLLTATNHQNGWESVTVEIPRRIGDDDVTETFQFARNRVQKRTCILNTPSLGNAHGVIGLDGTPNKELWDIALDQSLFQLPVLNDDERHEYIRHVLDMEIVPLTDNNAYHVSGATNADQHHERDQTLYDTIDAYHDESPALITSDNLLDYHKDNAMLQSIDDYMNYGAVVSSNRFGTKSVGIVNGSPHHGDDYCKMWAALDGETTKRVEGTEGMSQEFDSDIGQSALHQMREAQVAQAIFRFGRDKSVDSSTVYVNTGAIPDWLPTDGHGDLVKANDRRKQVIEPLLNGTDRDVDHDYLTYDDITGKDYLDVSKRSVKRTLDELEEYDYVETENIPGGKPRFIPTHRLHELIQ